MRPSRALIAPIVYIAEIVTWRTRCHIYTPSLPTTQLALETVTSICHHHQIIAIASIPTNSVPAMVEVSNTAPSSRTLACSSIGWDIGSIDDPHIQEVNWNWSTRATTSSLDTIGTICSYIAALDDQTLHLDVDHSSPCWYFSQRFQEEAASASRILGYRVTIIRRTR